MWTVIGLTAVVAAVLVLVVWHARTFAYRCRRCGNEFAISAALDFVMPQGLWSEGGWKLLRCPRCHHWTRARVIRKSEMGPGGASARFGE
jgi:DNA-directed RNA polymerase subunit RPC12/RpoP